MECVVNDGFWPHGNGTYLCACGHTCNQPYQLLAGILGPSWVRESGRCCICYPDSCDGRPLPSCPACVARINAEKAAQARQAAAANAQRAEAERARQAAAADSERALKEAADLRAELERLRRG